MKGHKRRPGMGFRAFFARRKGIAAKETKANSLRFYKKNSGCFFP